jgi:polygalacturonase
VYIEGGAVVYGFITGEEVNDIRILGRGILEGSRNRELRGDTRFHFIDLKDCNNIHIEGISLINGLTWQVAPVHCNDLLIENIKIISNNGSDDGIDLVRTNHVLIDGCFIHTKDDCMAIKSAWDYPGSEGNRDILVKNSVFWNTEWGNALEIGFELRADTMENITFRNCDVIHCDDGAVFSIHNADRSLVQNVLFEDIRVEDAHQKLFDLAIFLSQYSIDGPSDPMERQARYQNGAWDGTVHLTAAEKKEHAAFRGQIKNITFRNISVTDGIFPFSVFSGYDEAHIIENILIENLEVHGKKIDQEYKARISRQYCKGLVIR